MVLFRATISNLHYNSWIGAHEGRVDVETSDGLESFNGRVYLPMMVTCGALERAFQALVEKRFEGVTDQTQQGHLEHETGDAGPRREPSRAQT